MPDSAPFELPEDIGGLELDALRDLAAQAEAAFTARYDAGSTTPEDLQELQAIAEKVQAVRAAVTAKEAEASDPQPDPAPQPEPEPEPEPAPEPSGTPDGPTALESYLSALASRPAPEPAAPPAPAPVAADPVPAPAPAPAPVPASIAAGGAANDVDLPIDDGGRVTILASADIPGIPSGSTLEGWDGPKGLVAAIGAKARSLPDQPGRRQSHPVAQIQKPLNPDRFMDDLSEREQFERFNDLSSVDYLVASGGWCAPSETIYDFACLVEAPPKMVVLPTFSSVRGGFRWPISPTFRDFKSLENNGLFTWTEQDDIAAATGSPTKPCFHIPCVEFDPGCRLELEGLCVTAGNLTDKAYPELIRRYLSLVLTAHLHRLNTRKIAKMLAYVDDDVTLGATGGAAAPLLSGLLLQARDLRDQFSMAEGAILEGMLPFFVRDVIRADIARRECCSLESVTDAEVDRWLEEAGFRFQFVSDWQELGDPENPATTWPETVQILLWLPGALRELTGPTLDIAVARDSVLNSTNDYTVAFTEESYQICKPGCGVRSVTIPICPDGSSGEKVAFTCPIA